MIIGGIIVSLIIISIIILISSAMGSIGTITIGILFSTVFPILSFAIVPISNAFSPFNSAKLDSIKKNKNYFLPETSDDGEAVYDIDKQKTILFLNQYRKTQLEKNRDTWYSSAKYFDFWYQWGRFYKLLEPKKDYVNQFSDNIKHASFQKMNQQEFTRILEKAKKASITIKNNEDSVEPKLYVGMFSKDELEFEKNDWKKVVNQSKFNELTKKGDRLSIELNKIEKIELDREEAESLNSDEINEEIKKKQEIKLNNLFLKPKKKIKSEYYRILLWRAIHQFQKNNKDSGNKIVPLIIKRKLQEFVIPWLGEERHFILNEIDSKEIYEIISKNWYLVINYKENKYLETEPIIIFYSVIGIICIIASIAVTLRKDFK